jgi:CRP-like cAMP-binding protein
MNQRTADQSTASTNGHCLPQRQIASLAAYGRSTTWPADFQIYERGQLAAGFSLVLRGHVILRCGIRAGRGFVPSIVTRGETFGTEGLTQAARYVTDAYAADATETLYLSSQQFRAFVREQPGEALELIGQLMNERAALLDKLRELASQNVEQRLMSALSRLAMDRSFLTDNGKLQLEVKHHRLLCEMVGATRESIVLALGKMVASGLAERRGATFLIAPEETSAHIWSDAGMGYEVPVPVQVVRRAT